MLLKKLLAFNVAVVLIVSFQVSAQESQVAQASNQTETMPVLSAEQEELRQKSDDPKVNPKKNFKAAYVVRSIVPIEFSYNRYDDSLNQLFVVTPERTKGYVAAQVGLSVLMSIAGGGVFASGSTFSKNELKGRRLKEVIERAKLENPALNDIPKVIDESVAEITKANSQSEQKVFKESIRVYPNKSWHLVYEKLSDTFETAKFRLQSGIEITKFTENSSRGFFNNRPSNTIMCDYNSEYKPWSQWSKDDFKEVEIERQKVVESCASKIKTELPKLLELKSVSDVAVQKVP